MAEVGTQVSRRCSFRVRCGGQWPEFLGVLTICRFTVTQRLVALKNSGRERPLRSRDSVILDENDSSESRQSWGCC